MPSGGISEFQTNFYISEMELERARKGVDSSVCPVHWLHEEPLAFFCVQCDKAICMRCKLTKHENHETEDLTETAERCKRRLSEAQPRLEKTVHRLQMSLSKAQSNVKAAKLKRAAIKEQVISTADQSFSPVFVILKISISGTFLTLYIKLFYKANTGLISSHRYVPVVTDDLLG